MKKAHLVGLLLALAGSPGVAATQMSDSGFENAAAIVDAAIKDGRIPGAQMAVSCFICDGVGCRTCQGTGWIELLGCGMVHPEVLRHGGIDPERYSGWAFGLGIDRFAMVKYDINDIQLFFQGDVRFLEQF